MRIGNQTDERNSPVEELPVEDSVQTRPICRLSPESALANPKSNENYEQYGIMSTIISGARPDPEALAKAVLRNGTTYKAINTLNSRS
jgi:hypothetical protein